MTLKDSLRAQSDGDPKSLILVMKNPLLTTELWSKTESNYRSKGGGDVKESIVQILL
jgi:hypothetical protein